MADDDSLENEDSVYDLRNESVMPILGSSSSNPSSSHFRHFSNPSSPTYSSFSLLHQSPDNNGLLHWAPKRHFCGSALPPRRIWWLMNFAGALVLFGTLFAFSSAGLRINGGGGGGVGSLKDYKIWDSLSSFRYDGEESRRTSGGDGSRIIMENGDTFTYRNRHGGTWDSSPEGTKARAQSWTPPLSTPWDYAALRIYGVNLGGWLTLEPFITPALFQPYVDSEHPAEDEWSLSESLGSNLAEVLEHHYDTFITEEDFARISDAGLNWVRIPLPFWAVDNKDDEPFLGFVAWKYFLKAVRWARKYGLRVNLDLHTAPGSQNGWNHSGKFGSVNFMNGVMGVVNAQRTLNIIRLLTEFIMLPGNEEVIPMFGILNEPNGNVLGDEPIRRFYFEAYNVVRGITGIGRGPMISFHDGFLTPKNWYGFMEGADRIALDSHFYLAFATPNQDPMDEQPLKPCRKWAGKFSSTQAKFGVAMGGEWSFAINDCGLYVSGIKAESQYHDAFLSESATDPCATWLDSDLWSKEIKLGLQNFALAYMDTTRNWFFWTWKTGPDPKTGKVANPMWSYSNGLSKGYSPVDPRESDQFCFDYATSKGHRPPNQAMWRGTFRAWQTGTGLGAERDVSLKPEDVERWGDFPGPTIANGLEVKNLPTLTATGQRLPFPTVTSGPKPTVSPSLSPPEIEDSEEDRARGRGSNDWYVEVEGCSYPGPWEGVQAPVPTAPCTG